MIAAGVGPGTAAGQFAKLLSRGGPRRGWACLLLAAALAGCSAAPSAPTVSGRRLNIYLSAPASLSGNRQAQDVIDAEKLAFSSGCTSSSCPPIQLDGFAVHLEIVSGSKISDNARTAIKDSDAVAYLGEVIPGESRDSLGITNAQDLLQVSPAQDAAVPTKDFESYGTYGRTFASMDPSNDPGALLHGTAGKKFVRDFRQAYAHAPATQAIFGYAAMGSVLNALKRAGSAANDRGAVRREFFNGGSLPGGLGTYTVNKNKGTVTIVAS